MPEHTTTGDTMPEQPCIHYNDPIVIETTDGTATGKVVRTLMADVLVDPTGITVEHTTDGVTTTVVFEIPDAVPTYREATPKEGK